MGKIKVKGGKPENLQKCTTFNMRSDRVMRLCVVLCELCLCAVATKPLRKRPSSEASGADGNTES